MSETILRCTLHPITPLIQGDLAPGVPVSAFKADGWYCPACADAARPSWMVHAGLTPCPTCGAAIAESYLKRDDGVLRVLGRSFTNQLPVEDGFKRISGPDFDVIYKIVWPEKK